MSSNRDFDVVIWGASGFTGRLVAEYIYSKYGSGKGLKWAMAGRNVEKLQAIRDEFCDASVSILTADSKDRASLDAMVSRTNVVCSTVGPYAKYGSDLVASCVDNKTDYCDITGEVQWIRRMIDAHHETASRNKVKIVHCCGFDSIPSDMGVLFIQEEIKKIKGEYAEEVKFYLKASKGSASGGTIASLQNVILEAEKDKSIYEILQNPYGLNPDDHHEGKDVIDSSEAFYDMDVDAWCGPFIMAAINTKVVRRSHALYGFPYSKEFRYEENVMTGKGITGRLKAKAAALTSTLAQAMKPGSILKGIADRFLPEPGEGPDKNQRESGFFNIILLGKMRDTSVVKAKVTGDRDPGYGSTCKMLAESAICLALDKKDLPQLYGSLTPSTAMGDSLLDRLQTNAGLSFSIVNK